jgi:hypothetical protein
MKRKGLDKFPRFQISYKYYHWYSYFLISLMCYICIYLFYFFSTILGLTNPTPLNRNLALEICKEKNTKSFICSLAFNF